MKKTLKIVSVFLLLFVVFTIYMSVKTEREYDTKYKQILYGEKKGKDMSYCDTRASIGIEDYTSCMQRMRENHK